MTIEQAWGVFESHAMGCDTCEGLLAQLLALLAVPGADPSRAVAEVFPACCDAGQELVTTWDHLCQLALGHQDAHDGDPPIEQASGLLGPLAPHILQQRQAAGLVDIPEDGARERASALDALARINGEAFTKLLQLPKEQREAAIEAVVASYKRTGGVRAPEPAQGPPPRRACRNCGARIKNPTHELCNDCWRAENKAQQRRGFHVIPDDE